MGHIMTNFDCPNNANFKKPRVDIDVTALCPAAAILLLSTPVDVRTIGCFMIGHKSKLPWNLMTVQRWKRKRLSPIFGSALLQGSRKKDVGLRIRKRRNRPEKGCLISRVASSPSFEK